MGGAQGAQLLACQEVFCWHFVLRSCLLTSSVSTLRLQRHNLPALPAYLPKQVPAGCGRACVLRHTRPHAGARDLPLPRIQGAVPW